MFRGLPSRERPETLGLRHIATLSFDPCEKFGAKMSSALTTPHGIFRYREGKEIVDHDDVEVLNGTRDAQLIALCR
jgi:hypothetical protein